MTDFKFAAHGAIHPPGVAYTGPICKKPTPLETRMGPYFLTTAPRWKVPRQGVKGPLARGPRGRGSYRPPDRNRIENQFFAGDVLRKCAQRCAPCEMRQSVQRPDRMSHRSYHSVQLTF